MTMAKHLSLVVKFLTAKNLHAGYGGLFGCCFVLICLNVVHKNTLQGKSGNEFSAQETRPLKKAENKKTNHQKSNLTIYTNI